MRIRSVVAAGVVAVALAGCSHQASLPTDVIVGPSTFSEKGMKIAAAAPSHSSCSAEPRSDSDFPVTRVEIGRRGTSVVVTLHVVAPPTFTKTASGVLRFTDAGGKHGGTFTTEWVDQNLAADVLVTEDATRRRAYLDAEPVVHATTITTEYPALLVDRLGAGWRWSFTATVDGTVQVRCAA